jgi:hypothetical protein
MRIQNAHVTILAVIETSAKTHVRSSAESENDETRTANGDNLTSKYDACPLRGDDIPGGGISPV